MEKKQASDILESVLALNRPLGQVMDATEALPDGTERAEMVKAVGEILKILTLNIVFPIVRQYPELDPDK